MSVKFFEGIKFEYKNKKIYINDKSFRIRRSLSCFCITKIQNEIYIVGYRESDETYIIYAIPTLNCRFKIHGHWRISPCDYFDKYEFHDCETVNADGDIIFFDRKHKKLLYVKNITTYPRIYKGKILDKGRVSLKKVTVYIV